jgi:hypothetical protein
MKPLVGVSALLVALATPAWADVIHLKSGGTLEGVVLKEDRDGMVVLLKYASVTLNSFDIDSIERSAAAPAPGAKRSRISDWLGCFRALAGRPWGADLVHLPAPLIDGGDLKNVPYTVHASGDYQFVLFGDPDAPARVEVGVSGVLLTNERAREECVDLVGSFLRESEDAAALRSLARKGDKKERSGLVLEIDQEPDSRGKETWWVSVTDPGALDGARVSDRQVADLVTTREEPQPPRNPTVAEKPKAKGERQETIYVFGTEPENRKKRRRSYGGGHWGGHVRWNHGHATSGVPHK